MVEEDNHIIGKNYLSLSPAKNLIILSKAKVGNVKLIIVVFWFLLGMENLNNLLT